MQAKELGVRSVVIDGPESWSQTMEAEGIIEKFIGVDFSDADTVFQQCLTAIKKAQAVRLCPPRSPSAFLVRLTLHLKSVCVTRMRVAA